MIGLRVRTHTDTYIFGTTQATALSFGLNCIFFIFLSINKKCVHEHTDIVLDVTIPICHL